MKINIVTASYPPLIHPRSFRASELAKEFVRLGHDVTVTNITVVDGFEYEKESKETGVKIINLPLYRHSIQDSVDNKVRFQGIREFVSPITEYFLAGQLFNKSAKLTKLLNFPKDLDLVISLSVPFMNILGVSRYLEKHRPNSHMMAIADSGDPFYYSKQYKKAPYFKGIEQRAYKQYDYLTIPTENAIPLYNKLMPESRIKVIPQAFNMRDVKRFEGDRGKVTKFAYAGVFYSDIRNPEFMFSFLNEWDEDYEFHVYMRYKDEFFLNLMKRYDNLSKHTIINKAVPREELIYELSKMHFLVNIENLSNTQMPSKLIDYGISLRPIFSCNANSFSEEKFANFLHGNYDGAYPVDLSRYDVANVAQRFLNLKKQNV